MKEKNKELLKNVRKGQLWDICLMICIGVFVIEAGLIVYMGIVPLFSAKDAEMAGNTAIVTEDIACTGSSWNIQSANADGQLDQQAVSESVWTDYRSTVLPMIISVVITLLGCLITTYIFLKEALDRIVDQKPYAEDIIHGYRVGMVERLHCLFGISMLLTACTSVLYFVFWDEIDGLRLFGHWLWIILVVLIGILSWIFLNQCVNSEKNLLRQAISEEKITRGKIINVVNAKTQPVKILQAFLALDSPGTVSHLKQEDTGSMSDSLMRWLDLEWEPTRDESAKKQFLDWKSLIYHFSALEEWLLLLANTFEEQKDVSTFRTRLMHALNLGANLSQNLKAGTKADLALNQRSRELILRFERAEGIFEEYNQEELFQIYDKLSKYRNVLRFIYESDSDEKMEKLRVEDMKEVMQAYLVLRVSCFLTYVKIISKVQIIQPMERLENINLYNCRIEDSSFRGAAFQYALLARIKAVNTNFDMAKFQQVSFLNADIRNCALSNCLFENVEMEGANFDNVDFNYSSFTNCGFHSASFCNARFSSSWIKQVQLDNTDFSGSRMWEVTFEEPENDEIVNCIFSDTDIQRWAIKPGAVKDEYTRRLEQLRDDRNITQDTERDLFCWLYEMYKTMDKKWEELEGNRFDEKELKGIRKQGQEYLKNYYSYDLTNQNVPGRETWKRLSRLSRIRFDNSVFSRAKIRESCFYLISFQQGLFQEAQMEKAQWLFLDMQGCIMDGANLKESWLISVNLYQSNLEKVLFYKANLCMVNMADSNLVRLQASKSKMYGCYFNRSDCSNVDLTKARIGYSSFKDAIMNQAELTRSVFRNVCLQMMVGIDWLSSYSEFYDCDFYGAVLKGANFNYTTFVKCTFDFATLEGIAATGTKFIECSFHQVNFRNSCLIGTEFQSCKKIQSEYFENARLINCAFSADMTAAERLLKNDKRVVVINDN